MFTVYPAVGSVQAGSSVQISVDMIAENPGFSEEVSRWKMQIKYNWVYTATLNCPIIPPAEFQYWKGFAVIDYTRSSILCCNVSVNNKFDCYPCGRIVVHACSCRVLWKKYNHLHSKRKWKRAGKKTICVVLNVEWLTPPPPILSSTFCDLVKTFGLKCEVKSNKKAENSTSLQFFP